MRRPSDEPTRYRCSVCSGEQTQQDALTGLADRTGFQQRLGEALGADAGPGPVAVLLIDLDRFKAVNDTLGHAVGDALLCAVAGRIRRSLRADDVAARLGGDEFAVLLPGTTAPDDVGGIGERLVERLARPYLLQGRVATIGASIGAAVNLGTPGSDAGDLLRQADLAMYQAKSEGRNRFRFFATELQERADRQRALEGDLRAALALGQFELFYQPQVELRVRELVGFEALIRWRHPVRGLVPPDSFLPLAEQIGLIAEIGEWVLREACAEAATWPAPLSVAVNVAAAQFENGRLVPTVRAALDAAGLRGSRLELEIVETVLLKSGSGTMDQLRALKALGVQISLDDFGTGYSSLTQLRSFPFDRVKIDRSFADDPAVVRAVAALGASLGMRTTAEGVETADQLERLELDGCTEAQGYLLSRPVPRSGIAGIIGSLASRASSQDDRRAASLHNHEAAA